MQKPHEKKLEKTVPSYFFLSASIFYKVPMKPGGCSLSHNPKALEHPTGLPNPQPSHEPPMPGPQPVTHKPNGSVEKKTYIYNNPKTGGGGKGGIAKNH